MPARRLVDDADADLERPRSSTRSCSSFSICSSRDGGNVGQSAAENRGDRRTARCAGERRRLGREQLVVPLARVRNHAAAEVQRPPAAVEHHFHAGRVLEHRPSANRRRQRRHDERRDRAPAISIARSIDGPAISGSSPCTLTMMSTSPPSCRATSATRSVPLAQSGLVISARPPKRSHLA